MTDRDAEDLAPVTELFGARQSRRPARGQGTAPVAGEVNPEWSAPVIRKPSSPRAEERASDASPVVALRSAAARTGQSVESRATQEQATESPDDEQRAAAERLSMRALARRGVSEGELRATLASHDLGAAVIEGEVSRLRGVGLLDDAALAADLADRLRERKGLGQRGIVAELRRRQIDQQVIDAVMETSDDPSDEVARAVEVAEPRVRQLRGLDRSTAERRLVGFLMRRGYGSGAVRAAVERVLGQGGASTSRRSERVHFE